MRKPVYSLAPVLLAVMALGEQPPPVEKKPAAPGIVRPPADPAQKGARRSRRKILSRPAVTPAPQPSPAPAPPPPAPKQTPPAGQKTSGPGVDLGAGFRACIPGDPTPPGTVMEGYRKLVSETPFGKACRWELVRETVNVDRQEK